MNKEIQQITKKLDHYGKIIDRYPRDSTEFMTIAKESNKLCDHVYIWDWGLLVQWLGSPLTHHQMAKAIVTVMHHRSLAEAFGLPVSFTMASRLNVYQRRSKLTEKQFAQKYHITQSALSKMECGNQAINVDLFQQILRNLHKTFVIK